LLLPFSMKLATDDPFLLSLVEHSAALRRWARRYGQDADDLVQETLVRALAARHQYRADSNLRAWLHQILVHAAINRHRRRARDLRLHARLWCGEEASGSPPEPPWERRHLLEALAQLSSGDRQMIELADIAELRYDEVAQLLVCPMGTVMSRLHRARRRLRGLFFAAASDRQSQRAGSSRRKQSAPPGGRFSCRQSPRESVHPILESPSERTTR
jgi:RNA polymerase sigma-70 factor (ECF subfamily)